MAHSKNGIEAVIYDMDGVLIDSEPLHHDAERSACIAHGFTPPEAAWTRIKGMRPAEVFEELARVCGVTDLRVDAIIETYETHYARLLAVRADPLPGALEVLAKVRATYPKLALVTSSGRNVQRSTFMALGIARGTFDAIVVAEDVVRGKPAPDPYALAARNLGASPSRCIVIEDSDNGVRSAGAAGCTVIGITGTFPANVLYDAGALIVCDSHAQIGRLLARAR